MENIEDRNQQYWLKIGDPEEIAHEVNALCDLEPNEWTPQILSYGFLALQNYKVVSNKDLGEDNCPSFGYFIMTSYRYSLDHFLYLNSEKVHGKDLA